MHIQRTCFVAAIVLGTFPWIGQMLGQTPQPQTKASSVSSTPLSSYNLPNYVAGINYPDWFGNPALPSDVRNDLVTLFNREEWLLLSNQVNEASTSKLQPLLDALAALGSATNPDASLTSGASKNALVKNRDRTQDTPAENQTFDDEIKTIKAEIRYIRRKYSIPPSIGPSSDSLRKDTDSARCYKEEQQCMHGCMNRVGLDQYASTLLCEDERCELPFSACIGKRPSPGMLSFIARQKVLDNCTRALMGCQKDCQPLVNDSLHAYGSCQEGCGKNNDACIGAAASLSQ
jgi:hypothetical protein